MQKLDIKENSFSFIKLYLFLRSWWQKEGKKWWLHFKHFSGSPLKALGATSWISFAALLIRRCLQSFKTLSLEKTIPPRSCRKRFSYGWGPPVELHAWRCLSWCFQRQSCCLWLFLSCHGLPCGTLATLLTLPAPCDISPISMPLPCTGK